MKNLFILCVASILLLITKKTDAQITITNSNVASVLANKLIGPGVSISNITLTCNNNGAGTFVSTNAMLSIDSGIIITTGYAKDAAGIVGVNNPASTVASEDRPNNYADINLATTASGSLNDICKLEFDFIPENKTLKVKYKFASEEYPEYVCSPFNDNFGIFISGYGISDTPSIAVIPNTFIPIAINSVNNGIIGIIGSSNVGCTYLNANWPIGANTLYFNNSTNTSIVYDGTTTEITAKAPVTPDSSYHIKFVIADIADGDYDSGLILVANSLSTDNTTLDTFYYAKPIITDFPLAIRPIISPLGLITYYPNPANEIITFEGKIDYNFLECYSVIGNKMPLNFRERTKNKLTLSVNNFPIGLYYIKINSYSNIPFLIKRN